MIFFFSSRKNVVEIIDNNNDNYNNDNINNNKDNNSKINGGYTYQVFSACFAHKLLLRAPFDKRKDSKNH